MKVKEVSLKNLTPYESVGDIEERVHSKVFSIRLPVTYAEKMLKLSTKQRTKLMRGAVMDALEKLSDNASA